jgi:glycosyltransferase involved in cell wall biosynthesis
MSRLRLFGVEPVTGIGLHARSVHEALARYESSWLTTEFVNASVPHQVAQAIQDSAPGDINLLFRDEPFAQDLAGRKVYWTVFESTRPPPGYEHWVSRYDLVLTPSHWAQTALLAYGLPPERVHVVPEGVNPTRHHPFKGRGPTAPGERTTTRFLMIGKYETRKGYEVAFEAFRWALAHNPQLELLVKADWITPTGAMQHPSFMALWQRHADLPIRVYTGQYTDAQMAQLRGEADCLLFPSLCEGWGLPLIECIAEGVPVMATDFGGHAEYLSCIQGLYHHIPAGVVAIDCPQWQAWYPRPDGDHGCWARVDAQVLAACMLRFGAGKPKLDTLLRAAQVVRTRFTWDAAASRLLEVLYGAWPPR